MAKVGEKVFVVEGASFFDSAVYHQSFELALAAAEKALEPMIETETDGIPNPKLRPLEGLEDNPDVRVFRINALNPLGTDVPTEIINNCVIRGLTVTDHPQPKESHVDVSETEHGIDDDMATSLL